MQKANHYPSVKVDNSGKNNIQQYNTLVEFVKSNKYSVRGVRLSEYTNVVQRFADVLWEIDPNYHKLLTRNYSFPKIVTKQFLGFNDPKKHGHAAKPFNKCSLSLKITALLSLCDRQFMRFQHMKPLVDMINTVCRSIFKYIDFRSANCA